VEPKLGTLQNLSRACCTPSRNTSRVIGVRSCGRLVDIVDVNDSVSGAIDVVVGAWLSLSKMSRRPADVTASVSAVASGDGETAR